MKPSPRDRAQVELAEAGGAPGTGSQLTDPDTFNGYSPVSAATRPLATASLRSS